MLDEVLRDHLYQIGIQSYAGKDVPGYLGEPESLGCLSENESRNDDDPDDKNGWHGYPSLKDIRHEI